MALVGDWMQIGQNVFYRYEFLLIYRKEKFNYLFCYRKPDLYSMGWGGGLNLDDFMIASAPLGGPIALMRKDQIATSNSSKPLIFIFSSSGIKISTFKVC